MRKEGGRADIANEGEGDGQEINERQVSALTIAILAFDQ